MHSTGSQQPARRDLALYLTGVGAFFIGIGLQFLTIPWLVALELKASPEQLGVAQMMLLLPVFLVSLPAGVLADRRDPLRIVQITQVALAIPPLVLAAVHAGGHLSYATMLVYAAVMGCIGAVVTPAREGLLPRIAGGDLQRMVTLTAGVQFSIQLVANLLVMLIADRYGIEPVLVMQSAIYLLGAWSFHRLRLPADSRDHSAHAHPLRMIRDGFDVVFASPPMRGVLALNMTSSVLYLGVMLVATPLLVRDVYGGTQSDIATTNICNGVGTVAMTLVMLKLGRVARRGRVVLGALLAGAALVAGLAAEPPWPVALGCLLLLGGAAGTSLVLARSIIQEATPDTHRSRVMAIYALATLGGTPVGALMSGHVIGALGLQQGLAIMAAAVAALAVAVAWRTRVHLT